MTVPSSSLVDNTTTPKSSSLTSPSASSSTTTGTTKRTATATTKRKIDFLLGIPLESEAEIVHSGWLLLQKQQAAHQEHDDNSEISINLSAEEDEVLLQDDNSAPLAKGRWWEKWVKTHAAASGVGDTATNSSKRSSTAKVVADQLERPTREDKGGSRITLNNSNNAAAAPVGVPALAAPGRRLEGDKAVRIQIPLTTTTMTSQKSIARIAALREWELETAHGLRSDAPSVQPLLDGRLFFSAAGSYPISVFSMQRYEPKKEEAALRRQKLEARGGGGSQWRWRLKTRDWRGVSYRALLPRRSSNEKDSKAFNRFLFRREHSADDGNNTSDDSSSSSTTTSDSSSSDDSGVYVPGILDDPEMVLGRSKQIMIGDHVTGPMISSVIQFVEPALLKADLNKQFRERFDGWEPPKSARKYIGAKVIDGNYVLMDPTEEYEDPSYERRPRQESVTSLSSASEGHKEKQIRMPPSLTLSKIRSLKHQALTAAVRANLNISTLALACVYFERLCLDCRVDKSNRRLTFAVCLLLASKINEPNIGLVMQQEEASEDNNMTSRLQALVRPNKRSTTMFASLLAFFTEEWNISLKALFDAEWGVFAALGFNLLAKPSQVAFHFKRLMKTLEWNPRDYLGNEMYEIWQDALEDEEERRKARERRRDLQRKRNEERLLNLHIELENDLLRRKNKDEGAIASEAGAETPRSPSASRSKSVVRKSTGIKLLHRFGKMRRVRSQERLNVNDLSQSEHPALRGSGALRVSPSLPAIAGAFLPPDPNAGVVAIDIPAETQVYSDTSSIGSLTNSDKGGIIV